MYSNLKEKILNIKKEKDAIILAHYYQTPEVQDIADAVGDSFYLSKLAKENKNSTIVLCGVKFMAESAKILSPEKTVLLPVLNAGCPMADMVDADKLIDFKNKHKNAKVVTYINSSTEVKALSDVCCTSSNALKIIENIDSDEIIFLPDKNLGEYIKEKVSNKNIILWQGFCPVHRQINEEKIRELKKSSPDIEFLVHPEAEKVVRDQADFIGSTGDIIKYATNSSNKRFFIGTEEGIMHVLKKKNPDKEFITFKNIVCHDMKKITLEHVYNALCTGKHQINIDENVRKKAYDALNNMLLLSK